MGRVRQPVSAGTHATGFSQKLVIIENIDTTKHIATVKDKLGYRHTVRTDVLPAKGAAPAVGETWIVDRMGGTWTFQAIMGYTPTAATGGGVMACQIAASDSSDQDKAAADLVCTGTNDDVQIDDFLFGLGDSLNYAPTVYFAGGSYYMNAGGFFTYSNGTRLIGAGIDSTRIIFQSADGRSHIGLSAAWSYIANMTLDTTQSGTGAYYDPDYGYQRYGLELDDHCSAENLRIVGGQITNAIFTSGGWSMNFAVGVLGDFCSVRNVTVSGAYYGIEIEANTNTATTWVEDCHITEVTIGIECDTLAVVSGCTIIGGTPDNFYGTGVYLPQTGTSYSQVVNNHIENFFQGIAGESRAEGLYVGGNRLINNRNSAIGGFSCKRSQIVNNYVEGILLTDAPYGAEGSSGLLIDGQQNLIQGNTVRNANDGVNNNMQWGGVDNGVHNIWRDNDLRTGLGGVPAVQGSLRISNVSNTSFPYPHQRVIAKRDTGVAGNLVITAPGTYTPLSGVTGITNNIRVDDGATNSVWGADLWSNFDNAGWGEISDDVGFEIAPPGVWVAHSHIGINGAIPAGVKMRLQIRNFAWNDAWSATIDHDTLEAQTLAGVGVGLGADNSREFGIATSPYYYGSGVGFTFRLLVWGTFAGGSVTVDYWDVSVTQLTQEADPRIYADGVWDLYDDNNTTTFGTSSGLVIVG